MRKTILGSALCSLVCGISLACSSVTDTGNPYNDNGGETGSGNCDRTATPIELDAENSLGFRAADVIALAEGSHTETLAWLENELASSSGEDPTEIEVRLEFGEDARFVDLEPKASDGDNLDEGGDIAYESQCNDRLEIDATLSITSADGALDESVPVVVWAETARLAHTQFRIPTDEVAGNLEVSVETPRGFEPDGPAEVIFDVRIADVGFAGSIGVSQNFKSADASDDGPAIGGVGGIAEWPKDNPCDIGFPVPAEQSAGVQQAVDAFNGRGPLTLEYEPDVAASELSYELVPENAIVCEQLDAAAAGELMFAGDLSLTSADGKIEASLPVQVTTGLEGGELSFVQVSMAESSEEPDQLLESLGIAESVDFSGYDYGQVTLSAAVDSVGLAGSLSARGAIEPECLTNPPEPDPDGNGAPGCRGTDFHDLWVARFSE